MCVRLMNVDDHDEISQTDLTNTKEEKKETLPFTSDFNHDLNACFSWTFERCEQREERMHI